MSGNSANLKPIRPFNPLSFKSSPDTLYQNWLSKKWSSIHIEIGCGAGLHPIQWAQAHKDSGLIAIERTQEKFARFKQRLQNHNLDNIYAVNNEAQSWILGNIKKDSIDSLFFMYPNPYPKEKQANKRWHRNPFFEHLLACLKPNALIHLASNEPYYIEEAFTYFTQAWGLELVEKKDLQSIKDLKPRTHFEKKYLLRGEPCTELCFKKSTS